MATKAVNFTLSSTSSAPLAPRRARRVFFATRSSRSPLPFLGPLAALLASALFLIGCADDPPPPPAASHDAGGEPSNLCPDPDDPRVHYRDRDPNGCRALALECTAEQNGFDNACGCGCIDKGDALCPPLDDPAITWTSRDPAECGEAPPICPPGERPFNNSCGCGCTRPGG